VPDSAPCAATFDDRILPSRAADQISGLAVNTYGEMTVSQLLPPLSTIVLAAALSACMVWAIRPLLLRHALAKPNARSSHRVPTPQGAGLAVVTATLLVAGAVIGHGGSTSANFPALVFGATAFIALVGAADDLKTIPVLPRLILQGLSVGAVLVAASGELRIIPACPLWIERAVLFLAGLWFVNLVNFMDGIDWMTVAEVVPVTAALVVLGALGELATSTMIVAAALGGATLGFAPFNRPVAKIFLGDVGSLPIGLLLGWCLLELAYRQHLVAAVLLPLYYLADATATLLRRLAGGEKVWAAHRSHFYQRATDNGFSVLRVVSEVFALNLGLAALAIVSTMTASLPIRIALFAIGGLAVALVLIRFSRRR
jgi:UDP-N-acetylmuramyl pentapeptide phosphotransferase/UDP-N-acetylglucosamine-1-phosphate transferase